MVEIRNLNRFLQIIRIQILLWLVSSVADGHREHKVHNITLYPDKHSWCHVLPIKQVISNSGCTSIEIDNNVCVGACFSYSIPQTEPSDPGEVIVPYCDSCQPSETKWAVVELECYNDTAGRTRLYKNVQIINNCSCTSCEKDEYLQQKLLGHTTDDDSMQPQNDIPDLLDIIQTRNEQPLTIAENFEHSKDLKSLLNHHIITLLKNIQSDNSEKDKEQLMDALRIVQGRNQNMSDKSIAEFVDSLNTENIELDIPKLREILIKFEHSKYYEEHHKTSLLLNQYKNNDNIVDNHLNDDLTNANAQHNNDDENLENNDYHKKSYIGMRLQQQNHNQQSPQYDHNNKIDETNLDGGGITKMSGLKTDDEHLKIPTNIVDDDNISDTTIQNDLSAGNALLLKHSVHSNTHHHHSHHPHHQHNHHQHNHQHHHHKQQHTDESTVAADTITTSAAAATSSIIDLNSMAIIKHDNDNDADKNIMENVNKHNNDEQQQHLHHHHHHHHKHHHIGENIGEHDHLARGPHNSLILAPNNDIDKTLLPATLPAAVQQQQHHQVHEKLDVNAHELKPNHAGTLLTYSSHSSITGGKSKTDTSHPV